MYIHDRPIISCSRQYRKLLAQAAALGVIHVRGRPARRLVIEGLGARGFRRIKMIDMGGGATCLRAYFGSHLIVRSFEPNPDGSFPDQTILTALYMTAERMDVRISRIAKKRRIGRKSYTEFSHASSANEPLKPSGLLQSLDGLQASIPEMSANDAHARFLNTA